MKLRLEKTRAFWLYIVGGVIATVLGTMLLPLWRKFEQLFFHGWGEHPAPTKERSEDPYHPDQTRTGEPCPYDAFKMRTNPVGENIVLPF